MIKIARRIGSILAASLGLVVFAAHGQSDLSYKIRYDLEIGDSSESRSVASRAYIPDGGVIPIEIGQYQAELRISESSPGYYDLELSIVEGGPAATNSERVARVTFSGEDGVSVWFDWRTVEIYIKMEIVASGDRR